MDPPVRLTLRNLKLARAHFREVEHRDLFYRAALALIAAASRPNPHLDVAESIAVLLQTWNRRFYAVRRGFKEEDFLALRGLVDIHGADLKRFAKRRLTSLRDQDKGAITDLFTDAESFLGRVGAAKTLHLLAPEFFPIWDTKIAEGYNIYFKTGATNAPLYVRWMDLTASHIASFGGWSAIDGNPLKAIDEFNYCVFTLGWRPAP